MKLTSASLPCGVLEQDTKLSLVFKLVNTQEVVAVSRHGSDLLTGMLWRKL